MEAALIECLPWRSGTSKRNRVNKNREKKSESEKYDELLGYLI